MAKWGKLDFSEFEKLRDNLQKALDEDVIGQFVRDFAMEIGMRAIRKIKKRTPVLNGQLRRAWQIGKVHSFGDDYVVEIFNNLEYASFVENGFRAHWVPGKWEGNTFRYIPGYEPLEGESGGMMVGKKGWVPGRFMMSISMKEIEKELPKYLERRQKQLLERIMSGKPVMKGGGADDSDGE